MIKSITMPRKEKGTVIVLTAVSLIVIMGMLGLAIDLGHAYVNKTRLQNALDAMALSAAISLVNGRPLNQVVSDARITFTEYGLSSSIQATADDKNDIDVCFFNNYNEITAASPCATSTPTASSKFVRAAVIPGHLLSVATTFASFLGFTSTNIFASAVSGTVSLTNLCTLAPMLVCAGKEPDGSIDKDCFDGDPGEEIGERCYGFTIGEQKTLKLVDWKSTDLGAGNFGLLDVGNGGSDVCDAMAGNLSCTTLRTDDLANAQTGNEAGPTSCLNVRFDDRTGKFSNFAQYPISNYPADTNIIQYPTISSPTDVPPYFDNYIAGTPFTSPTNTPALAGRRVVHIPIVDCAEGAGATGSTVALHVKAMGCFLVTKKVIDTGSDPDKDKVFTEFVGDEDAHEYCGIDARSDPSPTPSPFAPARVVLFKDPVSGDA
jgi:Flp pilus assembly protein TadG